MLTGCSEVVRIGLDQLRAHPLNANAMTPGVQKKLQANIRQTGRYEPLVVRKHPTEAGAYEILNGHHRARVLRDLGETAAACVVWDVDDAHALLLLATLNRLCGQDVAARRLTLVEAIAAALGEPLGGADGLAEVMVEDADTLSQLLAERLAGLETAPGASLAAPPALGDMDEALVVFLKSKDKALVVQALEATHPDPATALLRWAKRCPSPGRRTKSRNAARA